MDYTLNSKSGSSVATLRIDSYMNCGKRIDASGAVMLR